MKCATRGLRYHYLKGITSGTTVSDEDISLLRYSASALTLRDGQNCPFCLNNKALSLPRPLQHPHALLVPLLQLPLPQIFEAQMLKISSKLRRHDQIEETSTANSAAIDLAPRDPQRADVGTVAQQRGDRDIAELGSAVQLDVLEGRACCGECDEACVGESCRTEAAEVEEGVAEVGDGGN